MKFIIQVVVIALSSYVAEQFFPWWCVVICAFLTTLLIQTDNLTAFVSGFAAISFLWMLVAAIIDVKTTALLSFKDHSFLWPSKSHHHDFTHRTCGWNCRRLRSFKWTPVPGIIV